MGRAWKALLAAMLAGLGSWAREEEQKIGVKVLAPPDLSIVPGSFQVVIEVAGGDQLEQGCFATVLLNNQEAANFTLANTPVQQFKLDITKIRQMVYDCVVVVIGPGSNYLGVFDVVTIGVLQDLDEDPASNDNGRQWTEEEIKESMRRGRVVKQGRSEHADEILGSMVEDDALDEEEMECGVRSQDSHLRAFGGLLRLWQGRRVQAGKDDNRAGFTEKMVSLAQAESMHRELYQAMRAASPDDPAMGMEGTSGQLYEQTLLYHLLSLSQEIRTVCETGFGAGHSAVTWLSGHGDLRVVSFDLAKLKGQEVGERFLGSRFPGRLEVVHGDSSWTVPEFVSTHPDLKVLPTPWIAWPDRHPQCDLIHVDGGHFDFVPWNDMVEFGRASHQSTIVVVDDAPSLGDVARAVKVAQERKIIQEIGCWNAVGFDNNTKNRHLRGFCAYHYNVRAVLAFRRME
ncbi:hypothetical protein GUITHDRAFT_132469 [Guillardia theta CCMP2712]|uniref:Uncharacterized protein n=1 Tax=Guillardia theta (strain CCMP2712) TaxID=905079 RepID=L1K0S6_GUITC|nr:hypothetical protein GUITHDRAFT_132469 [Guillardia theta CCMP2712]EKX54055.1 hypothetical protein GUITHDRAFT_132469 [Guillardia theta CCMP2712]|eukprot:XP_005841035.1 hypothetical protein GUITHDRAFT_132469 [Guillardia theta CCMP2712]